MYILLEPFKLTCLKDLAGRVSWGTWHGTRGPLCSAIGSIQIPQGPAMASEGPEGRGASCDVASSSFGVTNKVMVGAWWALFGVCSEGEGAHQPSTPGEEELTHQIHGPQQTWGQIAYSQGCPPVTTPAPGVPLTPGMLHTFSASAASLNFLRIYKERKREINENLEQDQFETKIWKVVW